MKIQAVTKGEVTDRLLEILDQQQVDFFASEPEPDASEWALCAKEDKHIVGGLTAKKQYQTMHISLLAVDPAYRKDGIGSQLLAKMEQVALKHQVTTITLTTKAYQALGFYLKQGYEVFGELEDVPMIGTTKYYLVKKISR